MIKVVKGQCIAKIDLVPETRIKVPYAKVSEHGEFVLEIGGHFFRVFAPFCFLQRGEKPNSELYLDIDRNSLVLEILRVIPAGQPVIIL